MLYSTIKNIKLKPATINNGPVDVLLADETLRLYPTSKWNKMACKSETLIVQPNYYIAAFNEQHAVEDKTSQDTP